jgi:hypothetical protein
VAVVRQARVPDHHASNRLGDHVVVVDRRDLGLVGQYRWWLHRSNRLIYATAYVGGQRVRMHKLLLPGAALVDHRDGNSLNNVRRNLRPADRSVNTFNSERPTGRTGERGVDVDRGRVPCPRHPPRAAPSPRPVRQRRGGLGQVPGRRPAVVRRAARARMSGKR